MPFTLFGLVEELADAHPDRTTLVYEDRRTTFAELLDAKLSLPAGVIITTIIIYTIILHYKMAIIITNFRASQSSRC